VKVATFLYCDKPFEIPKVLGKHVKELAWHALLKYR